MIAAALWASISLSATPGQPTIDLEALRKEHPELFVAPELPPWPQGLPRPIETDTGTILPPARATAVLTRLRMLDVYPSRCQARLDAWVDAYGVCATAIDGARAVGAAEARVEDPQGWSLSTVVTTGALGVVVGAVLVGAMVLAL